MQSDAGAWTALPRILYGFAIFPFTPIEDSERPNPFQTSLEIGSELYIFEVYKPGVGFSDEGSLWYRGYVVASRHASVPASAPAQDGSIAEWGATALAEEPSVTVGIFPATHCLLKERLEDDDARLEQLRAHHAEHNNGSFMFSASAYSKSSNLKEPLEPLLEEEDEGDLFGNLVSTPSKAKNRASMSDGRLSSYMSSPGATSGRSADKPRRNGHQKGGSISSIASTTQDSTVNTLHPGSDQDDRPLPPLPSLKTGDETAAGLEEPLVDEIACAIRESGALLYQYLHKRDYTMFQTVRAHIEALHLGRRQLLSKSLSVDELARLRASLVERLHKSSLEQGLDLVVRHPTWGSMADVEAYGDIDRKAWMSGVRMYKTAVDMAYSDVSLRAKGAVASPVLNKKTGGQSVLDSVPTSVTSSPLVKESSQDALASLRQHYHLLIDLKAFFASPCQPGETAELLFSLYNKAENRFMTEECCIILNHQGVPRDQRVDGARALFVDLSQADVLDALVLVCRIIVNGIGRPAAQSTQGTLTARNSRMPYGPLASFSNHDRNSTITSMASFISQDASSIHRHSLDDDDSMLRSITRPDGMHRTTRRPFGCAVVEISQFIKVNQAPSTTAVELSMPIFTPINEAAFSTLHEDIIASRIREFGKSPAAEHVAIGLRVFHDDMKAVIRDNPSLMQDTAVTGRLGFSDVVFPDDQRNDIYIKLWSGDFPSLTSGASKLGRVPINVEVEAEVRSQDGKVVANAISRGTGEAHVTRFTSTIYRHNASPTWGELLKLNISFEQMSKCHLFFTLRNRKDHGVHSHAANQSSTSDKPFAFAYLPLFENSLHFLPDGGHKLALYRYEAQAIPTATYLQFPAVIGQNPPSGTAQKPGSTAMLRDTLVVRSFLCSTKITQDPTLLTLLDYQRSLLHDHTLLQQTLSKLRYSPEFECVKMVTSIFDALFAIMASERNANGEIDDEIFLTIVNLLGLVNDRRFANFKPVLDIYIDKHFASSTAFTHLIRSLHRLIIDYANTESAQSLRASLKVWSPLFKFIIRSRALQRNKETDTDYTSYHLENSFRQDVKSLLQSVNAMMSATHPPSVIGTQTLAIQHFPSIVPDLAQCFPNEDLADIVICFCDAVPDDSKSLSTQKIAFQAQLLNGALMSDAKARAILIPNICRWLKPHLGKFEELQWYSNKDTDAQRVAMKISWLEGVRLATAVLAALLDTLHTAIVDPSISNNRHAMAQEQDSIEFVLALLPKLIESYHDVDGKEYHTVLQNARSSKQPIANIPIVFPSSHPSPLLVSHPQPSAVPSASSDPDDLLQHFRGELAVAIVVLIHISSAPTLSNYFETCLEVDGYQRFAQLLSGIFRLFSSVLHSRAFPASWLNVSMLAHKVALRIARPSTVSMIRHFIPDRRMASTFEVSLWKDFFDMLLTVLSSPSLLIEDFSPARQRAVWRLAGDIRGEGAKLWLQTWEALSWPDTQARSGPRYGGYQVNLTGLVDPVLELCLSHHDELRNTAVSVLYSLVISEFQLKGSFQSIENEILDRLDKLFSHRKGDEIAKAFFVTQLRDLFESADMEENVRQQVEVFLEAIDQFLQLLLGIRNLPESEEWQDDRVIGTLRLMAFIEKRHRAIFIRYVHRLVDHHIASKQSTEAALTLKLHADLYAFDDQASLPAMPELSLPEQTEFSRKEVLYLQILELLSKGKSYEPAIALSKVLQQQYEQQTFAYQRLSELLVHQADLYASIMTQPRSYPDTFRVGFFGKGYPASVQNKQFVYRAFEWEKYGSFCERMQNKHSGAQLIRGHVSNLEELAESEERYLVITPVSSEPDKSLPVFANPNTPTPVRAYYQNNETLTFSFSHPMERVDRTLLDTAPEISRWTEKIYIVCAESFPTILRRTEVIEIEPHEISPIEAALDEVRNRTTDLQSLRRAYESPGAVQLATSGTQPDINTNSLSMALNAAVDSGKKGIPLFKQAFFEQAYITANPDKLNHIEELRSAIDEQVITIAACLKLHQNVCGPDMASFDLTLVDLFERNFSEEISRMLPTLQYRNPPLPPSSPTVHTPSSQAMLVSGSIPLSQTSLSEGSDARHVRQGSNVTITSPSSSHLPFQLPPVSEHPSNKNSFNPSFNTIRSARGGLFPNAPLEGSPTQPRSSHQPNGVHFAPDTNGGRHSPVPSTVNGTLTSERPSSILSRFSSFRRKN